MQRDLFQSIHIPSNKTPEVQRGSAFLERYCLTLRLDQILVCAIGLLILYAMVFSIGVEKGKQLEHRKHSAELPKGIASVDASAGQLLGITATVSENPGETGSEMIGNPGRAVPPEGLRIKAEETDPVEVVTDKPAGNYTIQIVTYKTRNAADRHIKELAAKGLKAFAVQCGDYLSVCVDAFESHQKAKLALKQMKASGVVPGDAYVRNFPRQTLP